MLKKELPRCKFCGALPKRGQFGKFFEVFCSEKDNSKCPYPPYVTAETSAQADELWIKQFGEQIFYEPDPEPIQIRQTQTCY